MFLLIYVSGCRVPGSGSVLGVSVLMVLLIYVSGWRVPGSVVGSFCSDGFTDLSFRLEDSWVCC